VKVLITALVVTLAVGAAGLAVLTGGGDLSRVSQLVNRQLVVAEDNDTIEESVPETTLPQYEACISVVAESIDSIKSDLIYVVDNIGISKGFGFESGEQLFESTVIGYLNPGLDLEKPVGVFLLPSDDAQESRAMKENFIVCLPVSDFAIFGADLKKRGSVTECMLGLVFKPKSRPGEKFLISHHDGYAFLAKRKEILKQRPEDPAALMKSKLANHKIAFEYNGKIVSTKIKDEFWKGVDQPSMDLPAIENFNHWSRDWTKSLTYDTEYFSLFLDIDQSQNDFTLQTDLIAKEGSMIANMAAMDLGASKKMLSSFARDFNSGARLNWRSSSACEMFKELKKDILASRNSVPVFFSQQQKENTVDENETKLRQMFDQTLNSGHFEVAANSFFEDDSENVMIAAFVEDTTALSELIESEKLDTGASENDVWEWDFDRHREVIFHRVKNPVDLFGLDSSIASSNLTDNFFYGIGPQTVYLLAGPSSLSKAKECIDRQLDGSPDETSESFVEFNFLPIAKQWMTNSGVNYAEIPSVAETMHMIRLFESLEKGDTISISHSPIENGYSGKLQFDIELISASIDAISEVGRLSNEKFEEISRELNAENASSGKTSPRSRGQSSQSSEFQSISDDLSSATVNPVVKTPSKFKSSNPQRSNYSSRKQQEKARIFENQPGRVKNPFLD
jgi:hypothetical protein